MTDNMKSIMQKIRNHRFLQHSFAKYSYVGAFISLFTIFALWLLIDILGVPTLISSTAVVVVAFFLKYFFYKLVGFVRDERTTTNQGDL